MKFIAAVLVGVALTACSPIEMLPPEGVEVRSVSVEHIEGCILGDVPFAEVILTNEGNVDVTYSVNDESGLLVVGQRWNASSFRPASSAPGRLRTASRTVESGEIP